MFDMEVKRGFKGDRFRPVLPERDLGRELACALPRHRQRKSRVCSDGNPMSRGTMSEYPAFPAALRYAEREPLLVDVILLAFLRDWDTADLSISQSHAAFLGQS